MHNSELYARHLPVLRHFAQLLTGSSRAGDALIVSFLHWIVTLKEGDFTEIDTQERLLRSIVRLTRGPIGSHILSLGGRDEYCNDRLDGAPLLARGAFALVFIEGFTIPATAEILEVDVAAVDKLLQRAHIEISRNSTTDILIIEDELLIAFEIDQIIKNLGHRTTSLVRSKRMALKEIKRRRPQLILSDINLADGSSGIDAVNEMLLEFQVPVIFVTAYPERLICGRRPEPAFVVTKPFLKDELEAVIGQAIFFDLKAKSVDVENGQSASLLAYDRIINSSSMGTLS